MTNRDYVGKNLDLKKSKSKYETFSF